MRLAIARCNKFWMAGPIRIYVLFFLCIIIFTALLLPISLLANTLDYVGGIFTRIAEHLFKSWITSIINRKIIGDGDTVKQFILVQEYVVSVRCRSTKFCPPCTVIFNKKKGWKDLRSHGLNHLDFFFGAKWKCSWMNVIINKDCGNEFISGARNKW